MRADQSPFLENITEWNDLKKKVGMCPALPFGYPSFQIGCVPAEYDLFKALNLLPNLTYISFGIILTQFYINFSRQEH